NFSKSSFFSCNFILDHYLLLLLKDKINLGEFLTGMDSRQSHLHFFRRQKSDASSRKDFRRADGFQMIANCDIFHADHSIYLLILIKNETSA
ncbi:unnamed protein product, partial [Oikopleura dioica]